MNHTHHDFIVAWAKGATIEYFSKGHQEWMVCTCPRWHEDLNYRIKPEPKPDVVFYSCVPPGGPAAADGGGHYLLFLSKLRAPSNNMKVTINGETGKLKAAEVLVSSKE